MYMPGPYRSSVVPVDAECSIAFDAEDEWDALSPVVAPARVPEFSFHAPRRAMILIALAGILGVVIGMTLGSSAQARACADERSPIDCSQ